MIFLVAFSMFSVFAPLAKAWEFRPTTPEGPTHTNELVNLITVDGTTRVLIVTEGWGPLTGISPSQDKDLWQEVLSGMDGFHVDWHDGVPTSELLNQYDLVIYDAGGYWYPLSNSVSPLTSYHLTGKPLIVVAPDVNYDWGMGYLDPAFVEEVLHIEGVLGILPEVEYDVHAGTGHLLESGLPSEVHIPAQTSWPDCFDPKPDAGYALVQKYVVTTEFGVGTASELPSYSLYTPLGYYTVVAFPGSASEGKVVTIGVPVAGLSHTISKQLCSNVIAWTVGTLTGKQRLIQELYALNEETDEAIESQVNTLADLHTTTYLNTFEEPAWSFAKIALGFLAGIYTKSFLLEKAPFLYDIVEPLYKYHILDVYKAKKIFDALQEVYNDLDPSLGEETIRNRFKNKLMENVAVGTSESINAFETSLDDSLETLIQKLESMPEGDGYEYMISEVRRIRSWMENIETRENSIRYIDITSEKVIETRTVGGLSGYRQKLEDELEIFKIESKVNDYAAFTVIAGGLIKIVGWAFAIKTIGIGTIVTVKTETVGSAMMAAGGTAQTVSSVAKDLTKGKATAIIEVEATSMLINDIEAIGDVYSATVNLIENWDQKGEFTGECAGLTLCQDTYILEPKDSTGLMTFFIAYVEGFVSISSTEEAKGRIVVEVFEQENDVLQAIMGNTVDLTPGACVLVPFTTYLWDYLKWDQDQKIYRVVAYSAVGTTLYGPFVKMFRVVREEAAVCEMTTETYFSSIATGESYSESISTDPSTTSLYVCLDYPGSELDLHIFDSENRHVGLDYATGQIEVEVPNARYSGPDVNPEWISIEGEIGEEEFLIQATCVYTEGLEDFCLSYATIGQSMQIEPAKIVVAPGETASYELVLRNFDEIEKTFDITLNGLDSGWCMISPNPVTLAPNSETTILIEITSPYEAPLEDYPFTVTASGIAGEVSAILELFISWEYEFEDLGRGTRLRISTEDKFFQFIAPDKEFSHKKAPAMIVHGSVIFIQYLDNEIWLVTVSLDSQRDFCFALARDVQNKKNYILIDKPGIEG